MTAPFEQVDMSEQDIAQTLTEAKAVLPQAVFEKIEIIVRAYSTLLKVLEDKDISLARLRKILFGPTSEKSRQVLGLHTTGDPARLTCGGLACPHGSPDPKTSGKPKARRPPPPGHGRNGQAAYSGAATEKVPHHRLKPGQCCPGCRKGKIYDQRNRPGILVRVMGQPPLAATIYELQKLRCNLCGEIFEADPPAGVGRDKYDETAASMIALFRYGGGFPWNRLHKLQGGIGIPLPPSTQWEIVRDAAKRLEPAFEELQRAAAQGKLIHNDDTPMKILAWMGKRREATLREAANGRAPEDPKPDRTGIFTSGIVSSLKDRRIALFFTGLKHAGENLKALLAKRNPGLRSPIQMCDALARNVPQNFKTILANCLAHGRRQFVDQAPNFPRECKHILDVLGSVYKNDAIAKKRELSDAQRLKFHQDRSGPQMEKLRAWMQTQITDKKIEPNSGMGEAIAYMLKHWEKLTLFLNKAGAPLDNNICERALKKAILHRKNSLFYKTDNGAHVGDLYMSLIHTCDLNGVDPFDYLTQLQRHAKELRAHPDQWMPWNYRPATTTLTGATPRSPPPR